MVQNVIQMADRYQCNTDSSNIPSKFQSYCRTGINLNTFFRSILLSNVPHPSLLITVYASSTVQYESVYVLESIKSLILDLAGAER